MNTFIPPGVNTPPPFERLPIYQAVNGDDWVLDFSLFNPVTKAPATMANTLVTMVVTDNRFSENAYWQGSWGAGIMPDNRIPGLVHVFIPKSVTSALRRGVYTYSVRVTDIETEASTTTLVGYIQVEYEATSPNHNIPYRTPVTQDLTQYVTQEKLNIAVLNALKESTLYTKSQLGTLVDTLASGISENNDPSIDEIIALLKKLVDNLEAAKELKL